MVALDVSPLLEAAVLTGLVAAGGVAGRWRSRQPIEGVRLLAWSALPCAALALVMAIRGSQALDAVGTAAICALAPFALLRGTRPQLARGRAGPTKLALGLSFLMTCWALLALLLAWDGVLTPPSGIDSAWSG